METDGKLDPKECYFVVAYDDDQYRVIEHCGSLKELDQYDPEDALPALESFDFFQCCTGTLFLDFCDTMIECKYNEKTKKWRIV